MTIFIVLAAWVGVMAICILLAVLEEIKDLGRPIDS